MKLKTFFTNFGLYILVLLAYFYIFSAIVLFTIGRNFSTIDFADFCHTCKSLFFCHVEMVPERFETGNQKYQADQFYLASQRPLACFSHLPAARSY